MPRRRKPPKVVPRGADEPLPPLPDRVEISDRDLEQLPFELTRAFGSTASGIDPETQAPRT